MGHLPFIFLISFHILGIFSIGDDDQVKSLPGLSFKINYNLYSGYLNANQNGTWKMHYWLIESKSDPSTDPILVWFQGGPGCSSFGGAFEELGPFYINYDIKTLFENKYSWNTRANLLFLESPIGVGFSYDTSNPNFSEANDARSADQNYQALKDFFTRVQPKYSNRDFFLSGESYAGVYIPMLSARLTLGINSGDFTNKNFQGAAIGNGFMHVPRLFNSLVLWSVYHGKVSLNDWDRMKDICSAGATHFDVDNYKFHSFLNSTNGMDFVSDLSECGDLVYKAITVLDPNDAYNYYQDCYNPDFFVYNESAQIERHPALQHRIRKRSIVNTDNRVNTAVIFYSHVDVVCISETNQSKILKMVHAKGFTAFYKTQNLYNYESSDNQLAYPCWNWIAVRKYANRADVQKALNIDQAWQNSGANGTKRRWQMCNNPMYNSYKIDFPDQQAYFETALKNNSNPNFRFLIYNGDVDTVCNYLGDAWFVRQVAGDNGFNVSTDRTEWTYRGQTAGFVQRYSRPGDNVKLEVLTVKGAGHMVPNDRPAQSLQMLNNFLFTIGGVTNYNSTDYADPTPNLASFNGLQDSKAGGIIHVNTFILLCLIPLEILSLFQS